MSVGEPYSAPYPSVYTWSQKATPPTMFWFSVDSYLSRDFEVAAALLFLVGKEALNVHIVDKQTLGVNTVASC